MNAILAARQLYAKHGLDFERDLGFYLTNGVVISSPDRFIMAKPIVAAEGDDCWNPEKPDCWWVQAAVGNRAIAWFVEQAPVKLPLVAFKRMKDAKQRTRIYSMDRFYRISL